MVFGADCSGHSLRREIFTFALTAGSWVRIPLGAWMDIHVSSVIVLAYVCKGLAIGRSPVQAVERFVLLEILNWRT
jgi:hypothetical protein